MEVISFVSCAKLYTAASRGGNSQSQQLVDDGDFIVAGENGFMGSVEPHVMFSLIGASLTSFQCYSL